MNGFLSQVSEKEHFRSKYSAQRVKMATLKIRMVIGLIALLIGGLGLEGYAHGLTGDRTPAGRQYNVCSNYAQGLSVAGNLPVTANVTAVPVKADAPDGQPSVAAFDITISDGGREWQPAPGDPVFVTLADQKFVDGKLLDIYHQGANGPEFVATVMPKNGTITFPAYSFSVYIVGESHDQDRIKVVFKNGSTEITSYYVKPDDITPDSMFKKIVYDPGMVTLNTGESFRGWTTQYPYTADDAGSGMTIEGIRDDLRTRLSGSFTDGTEVTYYALIYKSFSVTYVDENGVVLNTDNLLLLAGQSSASYTVNMDYTPGDDEHALVGWRVANGGSNITPVDTVYKNGDVVTITGNVEFAVKAPKGQWLVFHENGKGATYVAPQFILAGQNSVAPTATMQRLGYTFGGWYTDEACTAGNEYPFGLPVTTRTNVYAKWTPVATAPYTIIIWKQSLSGCDTCYDFEEIIDLTGPTNTTINTVAASGTGNAKYASVNGVDKQYPGFYLKTFDQNVNINPEGDALLNVYYDRIEYTLKFIYYRKNGSTYQNAKNAYYTNYTGSDPVAMSARWEDCGSSTANHPSCTYPNLGDTIIDGWTYYYYPVTAKYGQNIEEMWPQYDRFPDFDLPSGSNRGRHLVSWVLMMEAGARSGSESGQGTVKGLISTMDEQILGSLTSSGGNYLVARYSNSSNNWTYNIWFPTVAGEDYTGKTLTTRNGVQYYLAEAILTRSGNGGGSGLSSQHQPSFVGYDPVDGAANENPNLTMNYYYSRQAYTINYMDGAYYSGNNVILSERPSTGQIHEITGIAYESDISSYDEYTPDAPNGFVFEGWYADRACTHVYDFTTMPAANITVYAKWRQIQYRVFLHPNAGTDATLDWGSNTQSMSFRIDNGGKVSTPTGVRTGYEFVGWYRNAACTQVFNDEAYVLNESTVTTPYDMTTEYTDPMNKWGIIGDNPHNTDFEGNRFWITKKFDLYAKWRKVIGGAKGIQITYNAGTGTNAPENDKLYKDNTAAIAGHASTPSSADSLFSYWDVMRWNGTTYVPSGTTVYPGGEFDVLLDYAQLTRTQNGNDWDTSYTVQLKAHYEAKKKNVPTFIIWYANDGTGTVVHQDGNKAGETSHPELKINEAVNIPAAPTRPGYTFKGWFRKKWTKESDVTSTLSPAVCDPGFLYYNSSDNKYYDDAAFNNEATQVAADEANPYDYLYAVWEPEITLSDVTGCGTATLSATEITGATYQWYSVTTSGETEISGATGFSYPASESGTYKVVVTDAAGCTVSATAVATVKAAPTVTMSGITMCATDGTVSLSPTVINYETPVQYKWDDATEYGTTSSITISTASAKTETHTVTVKDNRNCPVTVTATVTVNANPVVTISDVTNQTCTEKGLFTATVVGGQTPYQYKLDDQDKYYGDNTAYTFTGLEANLTTTPASSKTYTVKVVDYNGCFGTATQDITLYPEEITLEDINVTVCSGFTFSQRLTDNVDVKYKWSAPSPVNCLTGGEASDGLEDYFHGQLSLAEGCSSGTATYSVTPSLGVCTLNVVSVQVGAIFTVRPPVSVEITDPGKVCAGSSQTFTATLSNAVANSKLTWNFNGEIYEETLSESTTPQTHTHSFTVPSTSATATTCANTATLLVSYADVIGDACHADDNQTITIGVPEWSVPAAGSSEVTCIADLETPTPPAKQDFCGNDLDITLTSVSPNNPKTAIECSGEVVYTFTYSDCEGTENTWTHTVTVTGPDKPVITLAEGVSDSQNLGCTPSSIPDITAESFTVTDQCNSGAEAVVTEGNVVSDGCNRTKVWTANYSNCKDAADPVTITQTWKVTKTLTITANLTANAIAIGSCKYKIPNLEELTLDNTTETCSTTPTFSQNPVANKEYEQTD